MEARKLPLEAAQLVNVTQHRMTELQRGKIDLISVDRLIIMLALDGMHVEVSIKSAA
ncbi:XRE family transcriptional regulator [Pseudomonas caricapapayae]|uniref:XRE family transcriptional regulator n=1 Tax=Pseudomonas caricapapayae TaxID=46678 RepID=UPI000F01031B|nr:XRE family transcriptional regulator [Pseudomonas caricapapayae]